MRVGSFDLQIGAYEGYNLMADVSFWKATPEERAAVCGGCGPGKWGNWFVPDTILGERITPACDIHDWHYSVGKTIYDKLIADLFLWVDAQIVTDDGDLLDIARSYRNTTYYNAVRRCGDGAFLKGKAGLDCLMADLHHSMA